MKRKFQLVRYQMFNPAKVKTPLDDLQKLLLSFMEVNARILIAAGLKVVKPMTRDKVIWFWAIEEKSDSYEWRIIVTIPWRQVGGKSQEPLIIWVVGDPIAEEVWNFLEVTRKSLEELAEKRGLYENRLRAGD